MAIFPALSKTLLIRSLPLTTTLVLLVGATPLAQAQVTPDATLGNEASTVTPDVQVRGSEADLIEGGALRSSNLFHSFLEFNVDAGQRLYFANPAGVESILSRITGSNPSAIFGTLGVDGAADLFLINPNGLVFGETATLDIQGSFYASTAEAIPVGDGVYSATAPEQSTLLTVNPSAFFSAYLSESSGNITSRAPLAVGENLTLAANGLDLQRQVVAGGDLILLGNTVQIRDAVDVPFVGFAGGDLLVQGNEWVDIVALSHPDSGLYSYGDMVLRSANPVGGDAHYWSGGNFTVETLDGSGGTLFSPVDPIIRSLGDVSIETYVGSSLHILAGGAVTIGTAVITAPDPGALEIDFLQEAITLSDGTVVQVDGGAQPTFDVRAGVRPEALGTPFPGILTGFNPAVDRLVGNNFVTSSPSSADITAGDIVFDNPNSLVLLTNQYQANTALTGGNITVTGEGLYRRGIDTSISNQKGGAVYLDARGDASIINAYIDTTGIEEVGDVVINAGGTIRFDGTDGNQITGIFADIDEEGKGTNNNIYINATNFEILNGARINARVLGNGQGGNILINVLDTARIIGFNRIDGIPSGVFNLIDLNGIGQSGNIEISARALEVLNGAQLSTSTFGSGNTGDVILDIESSAIFSDSNPDGVPSGAFSSIQFDSEGKGGNVEISAETLEVLNGSQLSTSTFGRGDAGNVILRIRELAQFINVDTIDDSPSGAFSRVSQSGEGRGGNVEIQARNLEISGGAELSASTFGRGDAGSVILEISELAQFVGVAATDGSPSGALSSTESFFGGRGGNVLISAQTLEVLDGAQVVVSTFGRGDAGNIILEIEDLVQFIGSDNINSNVTGAFSNVESESEGRGGNVQINARNIKVLNGAELGANTFGLGDAGDVVLEIEELAQFVGTDFDGSPSGAFTSVAPNGRGGGGDMQISAHTLEVLNGARLGSDVFGFGDAGSITLKIEELARFSGFNFDGGISSGVSSGIQPGGEGQGGNVQITAANIEVLQGGVILTANQGVGDAGNVNLMVSQRLLVDGGTIGADSVTNSGGQVNIQAGQVVLRNDGDIQTFVGRGDGGGGNISIASNFLIALEDSDILAFSADGRGGVIDLSRTTFFGQNPSISVSNLSLNELLALDGNDRVDINATGGVESGQIFVGDATFVENSLSALTDAIVDTSALTAGSCIARSQDSLGSFIVTGRDGLPATPGDGGISAYPTGTVRALGEPTATSLQEPDGVYQLPDGRLVLGRACD